MAEARYRIDSLAIEGFKAFGVPQEIPLAGRYCFLFGANARGKSSIVEAIRWCLFGSRRSWIAIVPAADQRRIGCRERV